MSSLHRKTSGEVLRYQLAGNDQLIDRELLSRHGRSSRTLVKDGPLRLTVVALGPGGELAPHKAPGTVAIQVLEGEIQLVASDKNYMMKGGDLIVMHPGVVHSARSDNGGTFLLTVVGDAP